MATTTGNQAIRVPQSTDDPDVVGDLNNAIADIEKRLVMVFVSAGDRSSRVPAPAQGMLSYLKDVNTYAFYNGTAWVALVPAAPTFTSGTAVPSNATGANGDVFWKV